MPDESSSSPEVLLRQSQRLGRWARVVLVPVAAIGAVLSFRSLYEAARPTFGIYLAAGFPLLVDLLILGASLQYVAGAKIGRPMAGWRLTAHAGVAATLILNALAAPNPAEIPWHITAPAVWAVLVELTAKQVLGEWKATHASRADKITAPLWITAPIESARTRLLMIRTGLIDAHQARISVGVHAAAREALHLALPGRARNPGRSARRVRRVINRQLRAGSLPPAAILKPLGWTADGVVLRDARPEAILHGILHGVLAPTADKPGRVIDLTVSPPAENSDDSLPAVDQPVAQAEQALAGELQGRLEQQIDVANHATGEAARLEGQLHAEQARTAAARAELDQARADLAAAVASQDVDDDDANNRSEDTQQRLAHATQLLQKRETLTGPELQAELALAGWTVSTRTATRVLSDARRKLVEDHRLRVVRP
jgi:hypothetical protein